MSDFTKDRLRKLAGLLTEATNEELIAELQPILDANKKMHEAREKIDEALKLVKDYADRSGDHVNFNESLEEMWDLRESVKKAGTDLWQIYRWYKKSLPG